MTTVVAKAPGKLLLIGEYAVLYGAPAVVAAVDRYAVVRLSSRRKQKAQTRRWRVNAQVLNIRDAYLSFDSTRGWHWESPFAALSDKAPLITSVLRLFDAEGLPKNADLLLDSAPFFDPDSGLKLGLGSSAAVATALFSVLDYCQAGPRPQGVPEFLRLRAAHREAQGVQGSGVDLAASLWGGVQTFQEDKSGLKTAQLPWPGDLFVRSVWMKSAARTADFVAAVARFDREHPREFADQIKAMTKSAVAAVQALKQRASGDFAQACDSYGGSMRELGRRAGVAIVSTPHEHCAAVVRAIGAVYKPSGAGGGDVGVAICDNQATLQNLDEQLAGLGFTSLPVRLGVEGVQVNVEAA